MEDFVRVADVGDVAEGEAKAYEVDGVWIGVARSDGRWYAFEDECTHAECPLTRGFLEGAEVECECHGARFDLRDGSVLAPPATRPVRVFPLRVDGEDILVSLTS